VDDLARGVPSAPPLVGHPTDAPCVEVRTRYGRSVRVTGDHSLFVEGPDGTPIEGLYASGGAAAGISGHGAAGYLAGNGLLLSEGDDWRHQRRTIAPALAPRNMPMLARHIVSCTRDALAALTAQAGEQVDLLAAMQNLALEIAGRSMFSLEMRHYGAAMRRLITEYGRRYAQPHLFDMVLPPSIPTLRDLGRRRYQREWMNFMEEIMRARQAAPAGDAPRDLFDLLLAARDPESGEGFSQAQLRDQVATMILAGHETTAVTLFWSLVLLCGAPNEQRLVADEVRQFDITPDTAMDVLPSLVRTRAVVSEALRLYPPAFTIVRQAIGPDRAGAIAIPRGAVMMIAPWVLGRHRRLWRDPDAFDPSRFMPGARSEDDDKFLFASRRWGNLLFTWLVNVLCGQLALRLADHKKSKATYTPLALMMLTGRSRVLLLTVVWTAALLGLLFRLFWLSAPRWLYTALYLLMGWAAVGWLGQFYAAGGPTVLILIVSGGLLYTLGAVVYALKRPNPWPSWFGFHEIFHAFTIAAFICHYIAISIVTYA